MINGDLDQEDAAFLSQQIDSHDPISPLGIPGLRKAGVGKRYSHRAGWALPSNSFGLVIANTQDALANIFKNRWALFDKVELKREYRVDLSDNKIKKYSNNKFIEQIINKLPENFTALSSNWLIRIDARPGVDTLIELASELEALLGQAWPQNKVVDADQSFIADHAGRLCYSRHWRTHSVVTIRQQLFHWLLGFLMKHQKRLSVYSAFHFLSLADLIRACMRSPDPGLATLSELAEFEAAFRDTTHISPMDVEDELGFIISHLNRYEFRHVNAQIFWSERAGAFSAESSSTLRIKQTSMPQTLTFTDLDPGQRHLRFDPCDHEYGQRHYLRITGVAITGDTGHRLLTLRDHALQDVLSAGQDIDVVNPSKLISKVTGIDPQIMFLLPEDLTGITHRYNLEIKLQWLGS